MEFHLPDFDDTMFWFGAVAVIFTIAYFVWDGIHKRRTKRAREVFEKEAADIEEIQRKKE